MLDCATTKRMYTCVFGMVLEETAPTPNTATLLWSSRALNVVPGGVMSSVTYTCWSLVTQAMQKY